MNSWQPTILVVDDSPINIQALSVILKGRYTIKAALNGEKAIEIASSKEKPDLILLDVVMPQPDGYAVCVALKSNPATAEIPIIFVTAKRDAEDEEEGFKLGAVDYIVKPFRPSTILARVDTHLRLKELNQRLAQKVEAELAVRMAAQKRYRYLFESSPIPIFIYPICSSACGVIEEVNEAAQKFTGYTKEELLKLKTSDLYTKKTFMSMPACHNWTEKDETFQFEMECVKKDGTTVAVMSFARPLEIGDRRMIFSYWTDLSQIKRMEEEKLQKERLLIQQSKLAAMGEMIGAIAHQWRQPLGSLGLLVQDVEYAHYDGELDKEYIRNFKNKAMDTIKYMSKTIDDFKNFFSPHKKVESFYIEDAIGRTLAMFETQFRNNNISVIFEGLNKREYPYTCNKNELSQVILNIFANAKDVILERKPNVKFVKIDIKGEKNGVAIEIEDSAGGIASDDISKVFESHFTTKEQSGGTGIGLYMSKSIVEEHLGGSITVENTDNGAKFTIRLPLTQDL